MRVQATNNAHLPSSLAGSLSGHVITLDEIDKPELNPELDKPEVDKRELTQNKTFEEKYKQKKEDKKKDIKKNKNEYKK